MDENKNLKTSRYLFGGGVLLQMLFFALLDMFWESGFILYFISSGLMIYALFANLKAKGYNPFKKKRLYATALLLFWPFMGPLIAMAVMFGTPEQGVPVPGWRTVLFSPWTIALCLFLVGLLIFPQMFAFRARSAQFHFKEAKRHLAMAKDAGKREDVRAELDEASSQLAAVRKYALTDANTGWFVRSSLGDRIMKESDLAALEKEIALAKAGGPGKIKQ